MRERSRDGPAFGPDAPDDVFVEVPKKRVSFNPDPETQDELEKRGRADATPYAVSNRDVELEAVQEDLGWRRFFDGFVVLAKVVAEKPDRTIFERALDVADVAREKATTVGNDPDSDICGAASAGIAPVLVDCEGDLSVPPAAVAVLPNLRGLSGLVAGG